MLIFFFLLVPLWHLKKDEYSVNRVFILSNYEEITHIADCLCEEITHINIIFIVCMAAERIYRLCFIIRMNLKICFT